MFLAVLFAASAYFGPAQFWTIIGVGLALIGLLGTWVARLKSGRQEKKADSLSLYINFVDDLQVELKRLHGLLTEERGECARAVREKDAQIGKLEAEVVFLRAAQNG